VRLNDRDAELKRALILDARRAARTARRGRATRCCGRRCADEVRRVDLDLVAPASAHLAERDLRVLEQHRVLHVSEADGNAGRVRHRVRANGDHVRWVCAGSCTQYELERILVVDVEPGQLRRRVLQWSRDCRETLAVAVDVQRAKLRSFQLERRPFERDGSLGDVAKLHATGERVNGRRRTRYGTNSPPTWAASASSVHTSPECRSASPRTRCRAAPPLRGFVEQKC
jgi:hypothetical protein